MPGMRRQPALFIGLVLVAAGAAPSAFAQATRADARKEKPFRLGEAVGAPDWLKISGSVRPRYETLTNTPYAGRTGGDEMLSLQSLLKIEAHAADFVFGGEILDARRISGNDGGSVPAEIDALEPVQLYAAWRPKSLPATPLPPRPSPRRASCARACCVTTPAPPASGPTTNCGH